METSLGWEQQANPDKIKWINQYVRGPTILDLGTGQGWYSLYLKQKGFQLSAIDQISRSHLQDQLDFRLQSLEDPLPYEDQTFDTVLAWDIIEHVKDETQLIHEIHRVLKAQGRLILSVPHRNDQRIASCYLTYAHFKDKTHCREYLPGEIREKFSASTLNMQELKIELVGGNPYLYSLLCFIDQKWVRFLTRVYIGLLKKAGLVQLKDCHGDIFAVFEKK